MGFEKGSITFRRYRIDGWKHRTIDDAMLGALSANAFGRFASAADDNIDMGWVSPVHLFDVDFAAEKIEFGRFAHFRLRIDRNAIPSAILKSYVVMEELAAQDASEHDKLSKSERAEAKHAAKARAEKEMRSGAFRRIAAYAVLVDLENGVLYVGHAGNLVNERITNVLTETFDVRLEPLSSHVLAAGAAERSGDMRGFEDAKPCHLISPPEGIDGDTFGDDPTDRSFFGREFLTWLWHRTDVAEGLLPLSNDDELSAAIVKLLRLRCDFNLTGSASISADGPAELPESRIALARGKQPTRLGLMLGNRRGQWTFSLSDDLSVTGLSLEPTDADNPIDRIIDRFDAAADLGDLITQLYEEFIKLRLSANWPIEWGRITEWAQAAVGPKSQPAPRLARA